MPRTTGEKLLIVVQAVLGVALLCATSWTGVVFLQFPLQLLLVFSPTLAAWTSDLVTGSWWSLTVWYIEKKNGTKVEFYGDKLPQQENAVLICNHTSAIDWMFCWSLGIRVGCLGRIKNVLKSILMAIPIFGWSFKMAQFLHLDRDWIKDAATIQRQTRYFCKHKLPVWLLLFPEGTRMEPKKLERSQKFARENNLPVLNHLLTPRTKGWASCFTGLREHCRAVYDITIVYEPKDIPRNTFGNLLAGLYPKKAIMHITRFESKSLPTSEEELAKWCHNRFALKDKSIEHFRATGKFLLDNGKEAPRVDYGPLPASKFSGVFAHLVWCAICSWILYNYPLAWTFNRFAAVVLTVYACWQPVVNMFRSGKKKSAAAAH